MWGIKEKKKTKVKKTPSERVSNLPLGTGTLSQAADAIKKRKKKQADIRKQLGY